MQEQAKKPPESDLAIFQWKERVLSRSSCSRPAHPLVLGASFFAYQLASSLIMHSLLSLPFLSPTCEEKWPGKKPFIIMAIRDEQLVASR